MKVRRNETEKVWFRGERCFSVDGSWYLATREGVNLGPFRDQPSAQRSMGVYLSSLNQRKNTGAFTARLARDGVWGTSNYI